MSDSPSHRSGSVAVIGRPNVGKSTLTNALVGAKVSITSNRPQTTRHRLLGIATFAAGKDRPAGQIVLVDTPGLHKQQGKFSASAMSRVMNRAARGALEEVDAALMVVEAGRWDEEDTLAYNVLRDAGIPVVLVVNKVDRLKDKAALLPFLAQVGQEREFAAVHPVSALKRNGLEALVKDVLGLLPEAPPAFGEDEITDRSERFLASEFLREKLFRLLGDELPYGIAVEIEKFEVEGNLRRIYAAVIVDKPGHKSMVIGKGGEKLKRISSEARVELEKLFDGKVFLEVWVKVKSGWADDERALKSLGYE